MKIKVNGETKIIEIKDKESNLFFVMNKLVKNTKLVVVEFNGKILPSSRWNDQLVKDGDILEIVTIVGGGS